MCVARTLVTRPGVLLLDEPTSSLDAAATRVFEQAVKSRGRPGRGWPCCGSATTPARSSEWPGRVLQIAHGRHVTADPAAPPPVRREWAGERPGVLVGLTTSLVVVAAVVSLWQRLGLQRQILWSAVRALANCCWWGPP